MISTFPLRNDNLIGFTIDGTVDQAGLDKLIDLIEDRARAHDKIRLLANIRSVSGWDSLTTFWKNLRAKKELVGKIEKYALLSDSGWVKWMTGPVDWLFSGIEYRHFQLSEGEAAHTWLAAPLSPEPPAALLGGWIWRRTAFSVWPSPAPCNPKITKPSTPCSIPK